MTRDKLTSRGTSESIPSDERFDPFRAHATPKLNARKPKLMSPYPNTCPPNVTITDDILDELYNATRDHLIDILQTHGNRDDGGDYIYSALEVFRVFQEATQDQGDTRMVEDYLNLPYDGDLINMHEANATPNFPIRVTPLCNLACDGIAQAIYDLNCPALNMSFGYTLADLVPCGGSTVLISSIPGEGYFTCPGCVDCDGLDDYPTCALCFEPIDYCQGHSKTEWIVAGICPLCGDTCHDSPCSCGFVG